MVFGFLPVALLIYHGFRLAGRAHAAKIAFVLLLLIFYGWWDYSYVPLIIVSIVANFFISAVDTLSRSNFTMRQILLPLAISFFTFK